MQSLLLNSNLLQEKQEKIERKKTKSGKFSIFPIKYFCFGTLWEYFCLIGLQCIFNWGFSGLPRKICIQHVSFPFVLEWERSKCYQNSDVAGFVFCGQGAPNHNNIAQLSCSSKFKTASPFEKNSCETNTRNQCKKPAVHRASKLICLQRQT